MSRLLLLKGAFTPGKQLMLGADRRVYNVEVATQAEAQAGSSTTTRAWTPQRIAQAIAALAPAGGGGGGGLTQAQMLARTLGA